MDFDATTAVQVTTTGLRPRLAELLRRAEMGRELVVITRHGRPAAALVSMDELRRIREDIDDELQGPRDPASGRRSGSMITRECERAGLWTPELGWRAGYLKRKAAARQARHAAQAEFEEQVTPEVAVEARRRWWRFDTT